MHWESPGNWFWEAGRSKFSCWMTKLKSPLTKPWTTGILRTPHFGHYIYRYPLHVFPWSHLRAAGGWWNPVFTRAELFFFQLQNSQTVGQQTAHRNLKFGYFSPSTSHQINKLDKSVCPRKTSWPNIFQVRNYVIQVFLQKETHQIYTLKSRPINIRVRILYPVNTVQQICKCFKKQIDLIVVSSQEFSSIP